MSSNTNDLTGVIIKHSQAGAPLALSVALKYVTPNNNIKVVPKKDQDEVELQAVPLGEVLKGEVATLRYLARWAPNNSLYGADPFTGSLVDCWIDFGLTQLSKNDAPLDKVANDLNTHLQLRTLLADYRVTIADIYLWSLLKLNTNFEKLNQKQLPHLFRWFTHLSSLPQFAQPEKKKEEKPAANTAKLNLGAMGNFDALELPGATMGAVVTRFPPEPSGYLHIGHAKAALLNNHYAERFKGKMIVRFDDTNPSKEKNEYVEAIIQDLGTLGIKASRVTYTSDYFDKLLEFADKFVKDGKAYVDDSPVEVMRKNRWDGIPCAARDFTVEQNMKLWNEMKEGTEHGQKCVLRAKIDMSNPNKALRDPTIYRYVDTPHHRTGSKYKIYPIYDFACPIVDSLEGVTHALRSSEYHDRNPLYYWIVETAGLKKPCIQDFARLNFAYVLLSKRKLQWFVDNGKVTGWNDPRMPTIQGVLRRGLTLEALKEFVLSQGASKAITFMEMEKLWAVNKKVIDPIVPRYTAVAKEGKALFVLKGAPESPAAKSVPRHKKNPDLGNKVISYLNKIYLEAEDAKAIKEGEEITLMDWGNAIVEKKTEVDGVVSLEGRLHLEGNFKTTEKKLTWLPVVEDLIDVQLVEYDHLITKSKLDEDDDFKQFVNPVSKVDTPALGDPNLRNLNKGDKIQLERRGYFICDEPFIFGNKPLVLVKIPDGKKDDKKEEKKPQEKKDDKKAQEKKQ